MAALTADWFKGKTITVMGLGVHGGGLGAAKWLLGRGARVTVTDLREPEALKDSIAALDTHAARLRARGKRLSLRYVLGSHPEELFTAADMIIRNPAVPRGNKFIALAQAAGVPVESDVSIFFRLCPFPIAAISGTKGKTTTTLLLAEICRTHDRRTVIGGNVRVSVLDALDELIVRAARKKPATPIILELSSWQLESLEPARLSPRVAVLTNVMPDHLDRYDGMADYARAKELIVAFQRNDDVAVLNADNRWTAAIARRAPGRRILVSSEGEPKGDACFLRAGWIVLREGKKEVRVARRSRVKLLGAHNTANILSAVAAARAYGIPLAAVRKGLAAFRGVPHRLELVRELAGIRFVNDTAATAPDASIAALKTFADDRRTKRIVLLAGGADKNLEFKEWGRAAAAHADRVIFFDGTATSKMRAAFEAGLKKTSRVVPMTIVRSMSEAVTEARAHAKRGDVVLLSPGCASFGLFKNEFDRGDRFVAAVRQIKK